MNGNDIIIPGSVILKPRMLVIGRSPLLKISEDSGYTVGVWVREITDLRVLMVKRICMHVLGDIL